VVITFIQDKATVRAPFPGEITWFLCMQTEAENTLAESFEWAKRTTSRRQALNSYRLCKPRV